MKKISFNSPLVLWFSIISLLVLLLDGLTKGVSTTLLFCTYRSSILNPLTYVRLFTHCLGHASFSHYYGNIMFILLLGPMLEEKYGSKRLLICILITAGITGLINNLLFKDTAVLGASGIVFMFIVMSSITNLEEKKIPLTLIIVVLMYLSEEVYNAFFVVDSVSQLSHIVGGILGAWLGMKLNRGRQN